MTAKEYLSQAWNIDRRINDKVAHVSRLRDMATNVSAVISDMPKSPSPNNQRMETIIARLTDTEDEINADIDRLIKSETRDHEYDLAGRGRKRSDGARASLPQLQIVGRDCSGYERQYSVGTQDSCEGSG